MYTPEFESQVRTWAERLLQPDRVAHVRGVVQTADALARRYAPQESARVRLAGWIHDAAKQWDDDALLSYAETHHLPISPTEREVPMLLHGAVGYALAAERFDLDDPLLASACALHTTGSPDMTVTDKIVFMADLIEPGRDFRGVEALRRLVVRDLDTALLLAVDLLILRLVRKQRIIDPRALELRHVLLRSGVQYERKP